MLYTLIEIVRIDQKPKKKLSRMVEGGGVGIVSLFIAKAGVVDSAIRSLVGHLSHRVTCQTQNGG